MSKFIKVNQYYFAAPDGTKPDDTLRYISSRHIATMKRVNAGLDEYTELITSVGQLLVKETPEEIMKMMEEE